MSTNRENVTFQTADGKWNIGFWDFYVWGDDYEWDVTYSEGSFWYASMGHDTPELAYQAYTRNHSNPGGTCRIEYAGNEKQCELYLEYAKKLTLEAKKPAHHSAW